VCRLLVVLLIPKLNLYITFSRAGSSFLTVCVRYTPLCSQVTLNKLPSQRYDIFISGILLVDSSVSVETETSFYSQIPSHNRCSLTHRNKEDRKDDLVIIISWYIVSYAMI
jgi:hypothetical protein